MTPLADLMVRMSKLEKNGLLISDALVLGMLKMKPGMMGREIHKAVGFVERRQGIMRKLIHMGLAEDRRPPSERLTPNSYHVTAKGEAFLAELTGPL